MKKSTIIIIITILITATILFLVSILIITPLTGQAITNEELNEYTYTKAICNDSNFCQDAEIKCRGNEVVSITPLTGAAVQFSEDWQDPRGEKIKKKLCE